MSAIEPLVLPTRSKCRITPQERFDDFFRLTFGRTTSDPTQIYASCRASGTVGHTTVNSEPIYTAQELVYPGDRAEPVVGKWLYLFDLCSGQLTAEAFAETAGRWKYRPNPDLARPGGLVQTEHPWVRVQNPTHDNFGFLLSQVRLTAEGLAALRQSGNRSVMLSESTVRVERLSPADWARVPSSGFFQPGQPNPSFAGVPDPFRWAESAHRHYYLEYLRDWRSWKLSPVPIQKLLIACTLKDWKRRGLIEARWLQDRQPEAHIQRFQTDERRLRLKHELAAAYLAGCLDGPEHRGVERSALPVYMENVVIHWATVCESLIESEPGRAFLLTLATDSERFPLRCLLADPIPAQLDASFDRVREVWEASIAILFNLVPVIVKDNIRSYAGSWSEGRVPERTPQSRSVPSTHFSHDNQQIAGNLAARWEAIIDWITRNRERPTQRSRVLHTARRLQSSPFAQTVVPERHSFSQAENVGSAERSWMLERLEARAGRALPPRRGPSVEQADLGQRPGSQSGRSRSQPIRGWFVFEGANLLSCLCNWVALNLMIREYYQLSPNQRRNAPWGSNALNVVTSTTALFGATRWLGSTAGAFMGGVQLVQSVGAVQQTITNHEYAVALGHGLAAVGGWAATVGGFLTLAQFFVSSGWMLGPLGELCGVVAAVITLAAGGIVWLCTTTEYERFAKRCFLGDESGSAPETFHWSPYPLPEPEGLSVSRLRHQVEILCALLMNFTVRWGGTSYPAIQIDVGQFSPELRFEVSREHSDGTRSQFTCDASGHHTDSRSSFAPVVSRSADGSVTRLIIDAQQTRRCLVRLAPYLSSSGAHGFTIPLRPNTWVEVEAHSSDTIRSTELGSWEEYTPAP